MQDSNNNDVITVKEVILQIQEYYREVIKHWLIVLAFVIPLVFFMFYRAYIMPLTYKAELTFMVDEDEGGGGIGGIGGILGNFGLSTGASDYNLNKILFLSRTRKIIQESLFDLSLIHI